MKHTPRWILLVRHGQTSWNADQRFMGRSDIPLDDTGHEQARALANAMPRDRIHRVFTSPLSRAMQTAGYLGDTPTPDEGLRELDQGQLEGLRAVEAIRRYPAFFKQWETDCRAAPVPGGESMQACQVRGVEAVHRIANACRPASVNVAVAHQMVICAVLCAAEAAALTRWRAYRLANCDVALVAVQGARIELVKHRWSPTADPLPVHYSCGP